MGRGLPGESNMLRSHQPPDPGLPPKPRCLCKLLELLEWTKTEVQPPHLKNGPDPSPTHLTGRLGGYKEKIEIMRD